MIRNATIDDARGIVSVYNPYVRDTIVSFEEEEVDQRTMAARIAEVTASHPWLVFEERGELAGYAYAATWRVRRAFRHSVEVTVYLAPRFQRRGIATELYGELFRRLQEMGIHRALACISLPNPASVALHERLGFGKVAHFDEAGRKFGRWIDVGYWQLPLGSQG